MIEKCAFSSRVIPKATRIKEPEKLRNYQEFKIAGVNVENQRVINRINSQMRRAIDQVNSITGLFGKEIGKGVINVIWYW